MIQQKTCLTCGKTFFKPYTLCKERWKLAQYCSRKCAGFKKGLIPWNKGTKGVMKAWNKGKKMRPETRAKILPLLAKYTKPGPTHPNWKGENAKYAAIHMWVNKYKKKPKYCTKCGKAGNSHQIHWSNIDHKYQRNLDDYIALCTSCHKKHDLDKGLTIH